jgi:hypothetical protein
MTLSESLESLLLGLDAPLSGRELQEIPDYTSPPLKDALEATPEAYRSDEVIDKARAAAADGNCTAETNRCHIPFLPPKDLFEEPSKVGGKFLARLKILMNDNMTRTTSLSSYSISNFSDFPRWRPC